MSAVPPLRTPSAPGTARLPERATWLTGSAEPFSAVLHPAGDGTSTGVGALICPPFGWEHMASHGPRRALASALAAAGVDALRFDLPGQGDSAGGPDAPDRLDAWQDAVSSAADALRAETGVWRVVCVSFSAMGLITLGAMARGAAVDDLVGWGMPSRGRSFVRELVAFGRMEQRGLAEEDRPRDQQLLPDGWLAAGGYVISAQTRADLEGLEAATLVLPDRGPRRALLLDRDGIAVDPKVTAALVDQGFDVELGGGEGFGQLLVEPQFARMPEEVRDRIVGFAGSLRDLGPTPPSADPPPEATSSIELEGSVRESLIEIGVSDGRLVGVLARPSGWLAPVAGVFIGGTGHRMGPNRMWVEAARRWATLGVCTLRIDIAGAGDAGTPQPIDVPGLYEDPSIIEQARAAITDLREVSGAERILVVGLCAGAYWAVQTALDDPEAVVPVAVNLPVLVWTRTEHAARMTRHYGRQLLQRDAWRRLLAGDVPVRRAVSVAMLSVRSRVGRGPISGATAERSAEDVVRLLGREGRGAWLLFAGHEALHDELETAPLVGKRPPSVRVTAVPGQSDLHTLRPIWVQRMLHEMLDDAVTEEIGISRPR